MGRHLLIVNTIFLVIAGALGVLLYLSLSAPLNLPTEAVSLPVPSERAPQNETATPPETLAQPDYQAIVQKDLFRPGRNETKQEEKSQPLTPPPRLVGTSVMGEERRAYLEDPVSSMVRSYRTKDVLAGFTIHEIQADRAVLSRGDERVVVKLREIETLPSPFKPTSSTSFMTSTHEGRSGSTQTAQPSGGSPLQALPPALLQQLQKAQIIKIEPPTQGQ
jgi:hypothetical protein